MTQTDPKDRYLSGEILDGFDRNSGTGRIAGPGLVVEDLLPSLIRALAAKN